MEQVEELVPAPRMVRRNCRCRFPLQRENNPLFCAVLSNDLEELRSLVEAGNSVNIQNTKGSSLLNFVMRRKRVKIFNYLLTLKELDVNFLDRMGQSPLTYLAGVCFDEYFTLELIKKGADVHMTDDCGYSFLHLAAREEEGDDNLKAGQLVIEMGGNINQQAQYGMTPLYCACEAGNASWIYMLLYYGADANISTVRGVLPLNVICDDIPEEEYLQLQEILFNYTFCDHKIPIRLPVLVGAMTLNTSLFLNILDHVSYVECEEYDLQFLVSSLIHVKPKHLKLFIERFGYIINEMIDNFSPMSVLTKVAVDSHVKDILNIFLNSDCVAQFIQSSDSKISTISRLLDAFTNQYDSVDEEEITKMICLMLSYGLAVTSEDLDAVYHYFGDCELFRTLLHMDILKTSSVYTPTIAELFYDPFLNIEDFIDTFGLNWDLYETLFHFYNHPKLREYMSTLFGANEQSERLEELTKVPLLIELSRNVVRKFIVNKFNVKNSIQFYTIVHWLPIGELNKNIIAFKRKLY